MHFDGVRSPEDSAARIADTRAQSRPPGRRRQSVDAGGAIFRPTQRRADEFLEYLVDHADWGPLWAHV